MSRGHYVLPFTVTNPTTVPFLQLATPSNAELAIVEFFVGQEAGETSEQLALTFQRRTTASTLPTAAVISPLDPSDAATRLLMTTTTNAYGIATVTGTAGVVLKRFTFNALNGLLYVPIPEARMGMDVSGFLTVQFLAAPAANVYSGYVAVREF
jgi:hypothetical protein